MVQTRFSMQEALSPEWKCFLEAEGHCYLGETGGLENVPECRGDWRFKDGEGDTLWGLLRSPLWSFQSSSSFSIDRRLFTLDSFWRVSCKAACSVDSCLQWNKSAVVNFNEVVTITAQDERAEGLLAQSFAAMKTHLSCHLKSTESNQSN